MHVSDHMDLKGVIRNNPGLLSPGERAKLTFLTCMAALDWRDWLPEPCAAPQATVEGLSGGLDGFTADFESRSDCKELLSSAPGPSTEGSALPASTKMSSEYDLFDITSAMDWYEGDGGLLSSKVQARLPEDPFQQELLQGLNAFSAEEQQPSEPAWRSKGLSSSYEISRTSAASTMIPTDFSMERRHPSGRDLSLLMDVEPNFRMADPMEGTHRGGMLRPSMLPIKPQPAMVPCCPPQHPKTPPQPIIGHRAWESPFKASPPESDSSLFSCHSSYESVNILGDVPGVQAFSAPSFTTPGFIASRYDSLDSCSALDTPEDSILADMPGFCQAPPTPMGMCYAPMPQISRVRNVPMYPKSAIPKSRELPPLQDSVPMDLSTLRSPLAMKPDQTVHRQPQRTSKRKPAKYNDTDSFNTDSQRSGMSSRGRSTKPRRYAGAGESDDDVSEGTNKRRKHHNPWSIEETEALVVGVEQCGGGKWADIKKLGYDVIAARSAVDLKDKWRNLMRVAMLPHTATRAKTDKRREVPGELLERVRILSAGFAKSPDMSRMSHHRGRRYS